MNRISAQRKRASPIYFHLQSPGRHLPSHLICAVHRCRHSELACQLNLSHALGTGAQVPSGGSKLRCCKLGWRLQSSVLQSSALGMSVCPAAGCNSEPALHCSVHKTLAMMRTSGQQLSRHVAQYAPGLHCTCAKRRFQKAFVRHHLCLCKRV